MLKETTNKLSVLNLTIEEAMEIGKMMNQRRDISEVNIEVINSFDSQDSKLQSKLAKTYSMSVFEEAEMRKIYNDVKARLDHIKISFQSNKEITDLHKSVGAKIDKHFNMLAVDLIKNLALYKAEIDLLGKYIEALHSTKTMYNNNINRGV